MKKAMDEVKKVSNNINNLERKNGLADEGPKHLSPAKPITKKKELERFKGPKPTKKASIVKTNEDQLAEIGSFEESTESKADENEKKKEHKKAMKKIDKDAKPEADADKKPAKDKPAKEKKPATEKPAEAPANEEACKKKADEEAE